jgi:hypothetical protein
MEKLNLISSFFIDLDDYIKFLDTLKNRTLANNNGTCYAELSKENDYFLYILTWRADGKFIGDYIKRFEPTTNNINIFNEGCNILAERLAIYIHTNNVNLVPSTPAFGDLTMIK